MIISDNDTKLLKYVRKVLLINIISIDIFEIHIGFKIMVYFRMLQLGIRNW